MYFNLIFFINFTIFIIIFSLKLNHDGTISMVPTMKLLTKLIKPEYFKTAKKIYKRCNKEVGAVLVPNNPKGCLGESTKDLKSLTFYFEFCIFREILQFCPESCLDPSPICSKDFNIYGDKY